MEENKTKKVTATTTKKVASATKSTKNSKDDIHSSVAKLKNDDSTGKEGKKHGDESFVYRISNSRYVRWAIYILMFMAGAFLFTQSGLQGLIVTIMIALIPLFIGVGIAWILNPTVEFLERKGIKRKYGSVLSFMIVLVIILGLGVIIVPMASVQIEAFTNMFLDNGPTGFRERVIKFAVEFFGQDQVEFRATVNNIWRDAQEYLKTFAAANGVSFLMSIGSGMLSLLMGLTIGFYLLGHYDSYIESIKNMLPDTKASSSKLMTKLHITLMNWFKGWIIDQAFIFTGSLIFLFFFGIEQWLVLAIIMVATNLIPFVGPFIGIGFVATFLSVMLVGRDEPIVHQLFGYSLSPMFALVGVLVGLLIIQTIESMVIIPVAYKKAVAIHPVTTLASLSMVGAVFSPFLTPLTIPVLAAFKTVYKHYTGKDLNI